MKRLRILVVDDEIYIRTAIERTLESLQFVLADIGETVAFDFEQAGSAEEARDHITNMTPPDIMLLDLKLPGISGIELLEEIGPTLSQTLVIMITAYASIERPCAPLKSGAYDFRRNPSLPRNSSMCSRKRPTISLSHRPVPRPKSSGGYVSSFCPCSPTAKRRLTPLKAFTPS